MSAFLGVVGDLSANDKNQILKVHSENTSIFESNNYLIVGHGPEFSFHVNDNNSRVLICGIPCLEKPNSYGLAQIQDFFDCEFDKLKLNKINGHFAGLVINENGIRFFNDLWSYRDIYFYELKDKLIFSTRLDWICRYLGEFDLDEKEFSGLWLMKNQTSNGLIIKNAKRLGPGGSASFSRGLLKLNTEFPKLQINETKTLDEVVYDLEKFISIGNVEYPQRTLALSGGFDSRFLAALFNKATPKVFDSFTFGERGLPDVEVAIKTAKALSINSMLLSADEYTADEIWNRLIEFSGFCQLTAPVSEYLLKMNYAKASTGNNIIFDGGMAEIFRRSLLNRGVYLVGNNARAENADKIYSTIKYTRPNIFKENFYKTAETNAIENCEYLINQLPDVKDIGKENWFDYFSTVLKVSNYCGLEQARIDGIAPSLTPFVQPAILQTAFSTPLKLKRNAKLFKTIIKQYAPALTKLPLAKGYVTTLYWASNATSKILALTKKKLNLTYTDSSKHILFERIQNKVIELLNSGVYENFDFIDYSKISKIVKSYYSGNLGLIDELDWIVTLGLFLKSCK